MAGKKNFDSEFCGALPIQHINLIQDYGYLIVLDLNDLAVVQISENITDLTGKAPKEFINSPVADFISGESFRQLQQLLAQGTLTRIPMTITLKNDDSPVYHALMHVKETYVLLELEAAGESSVKSFSSVFQEVNYFMGAIARAESVPEVCQVAISELKKLSGFDGVLMYRFDEGWNGTVIAEDKCKQLEAYLGHTFPASDVPKQARDLYLKNPYRLIPNREFKPVRLYPVINPIIKSFIDLSDCNLRSVVGVHLEYMKHMGICASMSIRVIHNAQLWGLISCHHIGPKYLNPELCAIFEWLSAVISGRISFLLNQEGFMVRNELSRKRNLLTDLIYAEEDIVSALFKEHEPLLLDVFKAIGAAIVLNGKTSTIGKVPDRDAIDNLLLWLEGRNFDKVFNTEQLSADFEEAQEYASIGSGLLAIPIDHKRGELLICFRPEVIAEINWGGNPNDAINFEKDGKNYHPRNSFKLWKETRMGHSLPWTMEELEMAESLRGFLFEFRTRQIYK